MGRKKMSKSEKVRNYLLSNPDATSGEVAKALGVTPVLVYTVRSGERQKAAKAKAAAIRREVEVKLEPMIDQAPAEAPAVQEADIVNHPPHYTYGGIETIDYIQAKLTREEFAGYLKGNALKYGSRIGKKGDPNTDVGKMLWYVNKLRETLSASA